MIASTILLVACGKNYVVEKPDMPEKLKTMYQEKLDKNFPIHDDEKAEPGARLIATEEIAFSYMGMGEYGKAIKYYEELLKNDPFYFPALNNIAVMYEELGEVKLALPYQAALYQNNKTNPEVVEDSIRLLVADGQYEDALRLLEAFAIEDKEGQFRQMISSQFEYIGNAKDKAANK